MTTPPPPSPHSGGPQSLHPSPGAADDRLSFSPEQMDRALLRLRAQTPLPEETVRAALDAAIKHIEQYPGDQTIEPLERAIMLATSRLWGRAHTPGGPSSGASRAP